jgi:hypothetical protein
MSSQIASPSSIPLPVSPLLCGQPAASSSVDSAPHTYIRVTLPPRTSSLASLYADTLTLPPPLLPSSCSEVRDDESLCGRSEGSDITSAEILQASLDDKITYDSASSVRPPSFLHAARLARTQAIAEPTQVETLLRNLGWRKQHKIMGVLALCSYIEHKRAKGKSNRDIVAKLDMLRYRLPHELYSVFASGESGVRLSMPSSSGQHVERRRGEAVADPFGARQHTDLPLLAPIGSQFTQPDPPRASASASTSILAPRPVVQTRTSDPGLLPSHALRLTAVPRLPVPAPVATRRQGTPFPLQLSSAFSPYRIDPGEEDADHRVVDELALPTGSETTDDPFVFWRRRWGSIHPTPTREEDVAQSVPVVPPESPNDLDSLTDPIASSSTRSETPIYRHSAPDTPPPSSKASRHRNLPPFPIFISLTPTRSATPPSQPPLDEWAESPAAPRLPYVERLPPSPAFDLSCLSLDDRSPSPPPPFSWEAPSSLSAHSEQEALGDIGESDDESVEEGSSSAISLTQPPASQTKLKRKRIREVKLATTDLPET